MSVIHHLFADGGVMADLAAARGDAPIAMYENVPTASVDDGIEGDVTPVPPRTAAALERIARTVGLEMSGMALFCSEPRTTLVLRFAIPGTASELSIHLDTRRTGPQLQILHRDRRMVGHASASDRLEAMGDPFATVALHHPPAEAVEVIGLLRRLGLRPAPHHDDGVGTELSAYRITADTINPEGN